MLGSTQATNFRNEHRANQGCRQDVFDRIDRWFRKYNRIAQSFHMMREIELQAKEEAARNQEQIPVVSLAFRRDRQSDQRR